jgi:hypothetical protein
MRDNPSLSLPKLSRAVLVVRCAARSPTGFPRFRLSPPGSLDTGRFRLTGLCFLRSKGFHFVPQRNLPPAKHNLSLLRDLNASTRQAIIKDPRCQRSTVSPGAIFQT